MNIPGSAKYIPPLQRILANCSMGAAAIALAACASTPLPRTATAPSQPVPPARPAPVQPAASAPAAPVSPEAPPAPAEPAPVAPIVDKAAILRSWVEQQDRLYRVAAPLLMNNTELCPGHSRNLLGFTAKTRYSYSADFVEEAHAVLGLDDRLRITHVLPGGSAAQAGIRKGDILLTAGIEPMPGGENAEREAARLIASELQGRSSINLTVLRDGERIPVEVSLTPACAMAVDIGHTDAISSYADGQRVMITRGMLNLLYSDDELAYVVARQIARNVMSETPSPALARTIDALQDPLPDESGAQSSGTGEPPVDVLDPDTEELALYMLTRAGYDLSSAKSAWQLLGPDRMPVDVDRLAGTIGMKRKYGVPLVPDFLMDLEERIGSTDILAPDEEGK